MTFEAYLLHISVETVVIRPNLFVALHDVLDLLA